MTGIGRERRDLNGTGLDGNRLHLIDWTGLNWTGVHVGGVNWTGLDWTGLD